MDWLKSHGRSYRLAGYWNASAVTLLAANNDPQTVSTVEKVFGRLT